MSAAMSDGLSNGCKITSFAKVPAFFATCTELISNPSTELIGVYRRDAIILVPTSRSDM